VRRDYTGEMGRSTRTGDYYADAALGRSARVFCGSVWRAVCRSDIDFVSNAEFLQRLACLAHDFEV
jgi:hypothetical protein